MIFYYYIFKQKTYRGQFQSKIFNKIVLLKNKSIQIETFQQNTSIVGKSFINIICLESLNMYESECCKSPVAKDLGVTTGHSHVGMVI